MSSQSTREAADVDSIALSSNEHSDESASPRTAAATKKAAAVAAAAARAKYTLDASSPSSRSASANASPLGSREKRSAVQALADKLKQQTMLVSCDQ